MRAIGQSGWGKIPHAGVFGRAEHLYQQLDILKQLRQQVRRELLTESRKYQDEERRRIARELHDSAGQILAALSMKLSPLADRTNGTPDLTG